jgi:hypothetical protein
MSLVRRLWHGHLARSAMSDRQARGPRHAFMSWLPALVWVATVLLLGSVPVSAPTAPTGSDKVAHFGVYAVLGVLTARAWHRGGRRPPAPLILVLAIAVGALDEIHQQSVPGRDSDPYDFSADAAGVLVGFWVTNRLATVRGKRTTND